MNLTFEDTTHDEADALVDIRIDAMRESLVRIGRFNPQRARDRFLSSFDPVFCKFIVVNGVRAGFFVTRQVDNHLALEHLYIRPQYQGKGFGSSVLAAIFADADLASIPVRVGALRNSDSNRFYQRRGFRKVGETEFDIYYVREPGERMTDRAR